MFTGSLGNGNVCGHSKSSKIMITTDMPRIEYDKFNAFERSVAKYCLALVDIHVSDHLRKK